MRGSQATASSSKFISSLHPNMLDELLEQNKKLKRMYAAHYGHLTLAVASDEEETEFEAEIIPNETSNVF